MTEQEKQMFHDLCFEQVYVQENISWEDALRQYVTNFRAHQSDSQRMRDVLEEAIQSEDGREVSMSLSVVHGLGYVHGVGYPQEFLPLFAKLFRQEWHYRHEDMVSIFEDFKVEEAIDALGWAAQVSLEYLECNESEALARKAIYALSRIPSQQAHEKLQWIAQTSGGKRRKWALQKMKEQAMATSISQLTALFPPPAASISAANNQPWYEVETALGFELPDDYIQLVNIYGSQSFGTDVTISIVSPFLRDGTFVLDNSLFNWMESGRSNYLSRKKAFGKHAPEKFPFSAHPEPNGLLAFGGTEYGGTVYWHTNGSPSEWTIVLYDEEFYEYEHYSLSLSDFLVQWLSGQLASEMLETLE